MTWADFLVCLALLVATFAVYAPLRHFDFINYDDPDYASANPHVSEGLSGHSVRWALTSGDAANWFPVTRLSHIIDHQLFRDDSGAQHLVNVAIHSSAALLLFVFLFVATGCRWPSALVAFLFALHPLHVESVAWLSERKDTLCALFWFLTLWMYVLYSKRPGAVRYAPVVISFSLALLSKPMAVSLPFVLMLLDYWPLKRKFAWRDKVPLFTLAVISSLVTYVVQQHSGAVKALANFPLVLRMENAIWSYLVYLGQTFWPTRLAVFYPFPADVPGWKPLAAALVLSAVSAVIWRFRRTRPYLIVGWAWFVITLLPVIGIVQVGAQSHADRYMYLPMTGLLIMLAWSALDVVLHWPRSKPVTFLGAAAACVACGVAAKAQVATWQNSGTLFEHALAVTQRNYIAEHNLGSYLLDVPGGLPKAEDHLRRALAINPESVQARNDLGIALAKSGQTAQAASQFQAAAALGPNAEQPRRNLAVSAQEHFEHGVEAMNSKNTTKAISEFEAALQVKPDFAEAHNNLGIAYAGTPGHSQEAIQEFEVAVHLNPNYVDAQYNLGAALSQIPGREHEALAHFRIVEKLHPDPQVEQIIRQLSSENPTH
ncbi:MAG: tetratricopeptide repeat protein [Acidobacteriaceae bacterium]|nr:tetratricopeptide repeat protein [Acidobacteriaceae bacterium]